MKTVLWNVQMKLPIISGKKASPVGLETPITLYAYPNSQILEKKERPKRRETVMESEEMKL